MESWLEWFQKQSKIFLPDFLRGVTYGLGTAAASVIWHYYVKGFISRGLGISFLQSKS